LLVVFVVGATVDTGPYSSLLPLDLMAWPAALMLALRLKLFEARLLLWLGERSYGIYLVHYAVINIFLATLGKSTASVTGVVAVFVPFTIIVLCLSDVALRTIERPGRRAVRAAWARHRPKLRPATDARILDLD
jgi:peptidoglycan/LPS O-acetylase OafA/YrhL